jgi:hypothetical protein
LKSICSKGDKMAQTPEITGREILPIPDIPTKGKMALDARNAEFPAYKPLRPLRGRPMWLLS